MATDLDDVAALAADTAFRAKVTAAAIWTATEIATEVLTAEEVNAHDKARWLLAVNTVRAPADWTDTWAWLLAALPPIEGADPDEDLEASIKYWMYENWPLVAGVPI